MEQAEKLCDHGSASSRTVALILEGELAAIKRELGRATPTAWWPTGDLGSAARGRGHRPCVVPHDGVVPETAAGHRRSDGAQILKSTGRVLERARISLRRTGARRDLHQAAVRNASAEPLGSSPSASTWRASAAKAFWISTIAHSGADGSSGRWCRRWCWSSTKASGSNSSVVDTTGKIAAPLTETTRGVGSRSAPPSRWRFDDRGGPPGTPGPPKS